METDTGCDAEVWRQLSQELGLTAIHIPEDYGGQGFGVSELAIAVEEGSTMVRVGTALFGARGA